MVTGDKYRRGIQNKDDVVSTFCVGSRIRTPTYVRGHRLLPGAAGR
jgi:hypothetical protein